MTRTTRSSGGSARTRAFEAFQWYDQRVRTYFYGLVMMEPYGPSNFDTPCTLTRSDSEANVGITGGELGAPPNQGRVRAAQRKVKAWPEEHDRKAIVISAGRVCRPEAAT